MKTSFSIKNVRPLSAMVGISFFTTGTVLAGIGFAIFVGNIGLTAKGAK
jgi:hypothetical protein